MSDDHELEQSSGSAEEGLPMGKQQGIPGWFYNWAIHFDDKLGKVTEKIHDVDKKAAVIEKATEDLPAIRSKLDFLTNRYWLAVGGLALLLLLLEFYSLPSLDEIQNMFRSTLVEKSTTHEISPASNQDPPVVPSNKEIKSN